MDPERHPPRRSKSAQFAGLAAWILVTFAAAAVGSIASVNAGDFYEDLSRPAWAPPPWLFGPTWSFLYLTMAVSAWLVWRRHGFTSARTALSLYLVQLAANSLWTWLFFAWRLGAVAFAEIVLLWILVLMTILAFWIVHRVAALLLLPYLSWVTYAAALTLSVWQRNPMVL